MGGGLVLVVVALRRGAQQADHRPYLVERAHAVLPYGFQHRELFGKKDEPTRQEKVTA